MGGVPATGVTSVVLNVTAANASGPQSFLTVWPKGTTRPLASNLNFTAGVSVPNLVVARVGDGGSVSIYNDSGTVDVVADVQGWYSNAVDAVGSSFVPVNPARLLDTRVGTGTGGSVAPVGPGTLIQLQVAGAGGVPATGARAVVLNMTVDRATGPESFLTVWPSATPRPLASNLNFTSGPATTNLVVAQLGPDGKVNIYNNLGLDRRHRRRRGLVRGAGHAAAGIPLLRPEPRPGSWTPASGPGPAAPSAACPPAGPWT